MTDSAGTMGSDGGEAVERDKKKLSSTSAFGNKATRDLGMLGEETKSDCGVHPTAHEMKMKRNYVIKVERPGRPANAMPRVVITSTVQ